MRFARGEQVETTWGVPVQLSRPLDWLAMTDHSDLLGATPLMRAGDASVMSDPTVKKWNQAMNSGDLDVITAAAMEAIQAQGNGTLPEILQNEKVFRQSWTDYTSIMEDFNEPGRFTALIGYEWTPNPGPGNNMHRNVIYRGGKEAADQMLPYTTFESVDPEDLWKWMENYEQRTGSH